MNIKVAVIGMGQGGMVAAIKLAETGAAVDIYEKSSADRVGYPWKDDIRADIFSIVGLPMPSDNIYCQKEKWLFVSPSEKYCLPVPPSPQMEEISIDRRGLTEYFVCLALNAGCRIFYGHEIKNLLVKNNKVVGIEDEGSPVYYDLIIDASGLNSVLRSQTPADCGILHKPDKEGVLYGYRAFYKRNPNAETREKDVNCTMVIKHLNGNGISWCNLNDNGDVDVLIARIGELTDEEIMVMTEDLREKNPILSDELLYGTKVEICLRCTLPIGVTDGYIAIGDSAFMTMPLMGSGIESSMKAGNMLAEYVKKENITEFSTEQLWKFWVTYIRTIGNQFVFIDIVKRWALSDKLSPATVDWVFASGLIEKKDLVLVTTEETKIHIGAKTIFKKLFILLSRPSFIISAVKAVARGLKAKRTAEKIPDKYERKSVLKWAKRYENILHK